MVSIHALRGTSFYILEIFDRDKDSSVCSSVEGNEEEVVFRIKIIQCLLAVANMDCIAIVNVLWGVDVYFGKLKP